MFLFACVCVRVCCCCLRWVVLLLLLCVVPRLRSTQQNNPERVAGTNNDEGSNIRGHDIPALLPLTRNKSAPVTRAKPKILPGQTNYARAKSAPARTKEHISEFKARVNAEMKTARKMLAKLKRTCNISSGKVKQQQSKLFDSLDTLLENLYTTSCKPSVVDKSLDDMALCQICINTAVRCIINVTCF